METHAARAHSTESAPCAIVARTTKGWGFTPVLGSSVHGRPASAAEQPKAFAALDATAQRLGATWTQGALCIPPLPAVAPSRTPSAQPPPPFREALQRFGQAEVLDKGQFATRKAYGVALQALGHANPHVVALDGDVRNSTYSENFLHDQALAERFFECRIAEQHMVSCAGGLAAGAKVPFVSTFGKFIVRSYDQVEMGLISRFNLKLIGSHTGVSLAADGPSQMALPDVAFFRAWSTVRTDQGAPLLYLLQPADAYAAYALTVEDNYGAGIGSAVADALTAHGGTYTLAQMFVRQIPKSGRTPEDVLRFLHLSADDIVATGMRLVEVAV